MKNITLAIDEQVLKGSARHTQSATWDDRQRAWCASIWRG